MCMNISVEKERKSTDNLYTKQINSFIPMAFVREDIRNCRWQIWEHDQPSEGATALDYTGHSIAPGLVDTHIHGFGGVGRYGQQHRGNPSYYEMRGFE